MLPDKIRAAWQPAVWAATAGRGYDVTQYDSR